MHLWTRHPLGHVTPKTHPRPPFHRYHATYVSSIAYSSPSIVIDAGRYPDGRRVMYDDYREAYYWLRQVHLSPAHLASTDSPTRFTYQIYIPDLPASFADQTRLPGLALYLIRAYALTLCW